MNVSYGYDFSELPVGRFFVNFRVDRTAGVSKGSLELDFVKNGILF